MPHSRCHKKKVTGRYQLQFPLNWVRDHLRGRTAEEWREIIIAAWDVSSPDLQRQWRHTFESTIDDLMKTTLTVKNRTGRRFDRDAYAREAHFVYGPAVSPSDASPKLLARCFKHSVDFVLHHGLSNSTVADSCTNTGEHTVPSDPGRSDLPSANSGETEKSTMRNLWANALSSKLPPMTFRFGREPVPDPDPMMMDMQEDDDQYTQLLDEMLNSPEDELFSCEEDLQLQDEPEHMPDLPLFDDSCPSSPLHPESSEDVWRSTPTLEEYAYAPGREGDASMSDCVELQLLRAREDLAAARQQRDDAVRLCQQLQLQLAEAAEQRAQSPGTDVPEDGCFR